MIDNLNNLLEVFYIIATLVSSVITLVIGCFVGMIVRKRVCEATIGSAEKEAENILINAKKEAEGKKKEILLEAKEESLKIKNEIEKECKERKQEMLKFERRLIQKEEVLDKKSHNLERKEELHQEKLIKLQKEEEKIDFDKSSTDIHNRIRGLSSIPGAYAMLDNKRVKIYESFITDKVSNKEPGTIIDINKDGMFVATKDRIIKITDLKIEGKKRCKIQDFINGVKKGDYINKKLI